MLVQRVVADISVSVFIASSLAISGLSILHMAAAQALPFEHEIALAGNFKPARVERTGGAVDHVAAASAVLIVALGAAQLISPFLVSPCTGLKNGTASAVLALQWIAGALVMMLQQRDPLPLAVQVGTALVGLQNSGLARLTDQVELKRELRLPKASALDRPASDPGDQETRLGCE